MPKREPELTPEQYEAQQHVLNELRSLRREGEEFIRRRDRTVYKAHKLALSLRQIGTEVGLSAQGVSNVIERERDIEAAMSE